METRDNARNAERPMNPRADLGLSDRVLVSGGRLFAIIVILMAVVLASTKDFLRCFDFHTLRP